LQLENVLPSAFLLEFIGNQSSSLQSQAMLLNAFAGISSKCEASQSLDKISALQDGASPNQVSTAPRCHHQPNKTTRQRESVVGPDFHLCVATME